MEHINKYIIQSRYEYISKNGIVWTEWFNLTDGVSDDMDLLKMRINSYKEKDKSLKNKLKHEYRIEKYIDPGKVVALEYMYYKPKKTKKVSRKSKKTSDI